MKKAIILLCILVTYKISIAQNTFPTSGDAGIGTTSPEVKLHIVGSNHMVKIENTDGTTASQYAQIQLKAGTAANYIWTNNQNSTGFYGGSSALNIYTGQNSPIAFFTNNTEKMRIDGNGSVGIGNTSPLGGLNVSWGTNAYNAIYATNDNATYATVSLANSAAGGFGMYSNADKNYFSGNVGMGIINAETKLHIVGSNHMVKIENTDGTTASQYAQMQLKAGSASNYIWTNNQNSPGFYGGSGALNIYTGQDSPIAFFTNGSNERMRVDGNGNVGIGTSTPTAKLAVNGTIRAAEVKVEAGPWPDFVFEDGYELKGLERLEKFIKVNKHLPEIPSAVEVRKEGVNLGEINAKLLQKIEELTLYLIQKDREIKNLNERMNKLEK